MKYILAICLIAIFLFGCTSQSEQPVQQEQQKPVCKTMTKQQTVTRSVCQNLSKTSTVCNERSMNYSILSSTTSTICTSGACSGISLYDCMDCSGAMTRCMSTVKSNEKNSSGIIEMAANFTFPNGAFVKNPVSHTIKPGQNTTFDFYQSYSLAT